MMNTPNIDLKRTDVRTEQGRGDWIDLGRMIRAAAARKAAAAMSAAPTTGSAEDPDRRRSLVN